MVSMRMCAIFMERMKMPLLSPMQFSSELWHAQQLSTLELPPSRRNAKIDDFFFC